jgi:hypothetical protein
VQARPETKDGKPQCFIQVGFNLACNYYLGLKCLPEIICLHSQGPKGKLNIYTRHQNWSALRTLKKLISSHLLAFEKKYLIQVCLFSVFNTPHQGKIHLYGIRRFSSPCHLLHIHGEQTLF